MRIATALLAITSLAILAAPSTSRCADRPLHLSQRMTDYLGRRAVVYPKPAEVINPAVRSGYTAPVAAADSLRLWVFFTDKGPDAEIALHDDALQAAVLERSLSRRAKVARDSLLFLDLPVEQTYVNTITSLGATHLADSRWFNAAAFRLAPEETYVLDQIAALPFVLEIRPCARGTRSAPPSVENTSTPDIRSDQTSRLATPATLNYGPSFAQLEQIGAVEGHDSGYTGAGITVAIFDTGFRTTHDAFYAALSEGRVIGEWDFVQGDGITANQEGDPSNQWDHGTLTWSTMGAEWDGNVYGPAYEANFVIAKTEVLAEETIQEEYDWIAAMEWADSLGAEVISSSLVFNGYPYSALDGQTVLASIAIGTAADLGIIVCNGAGNSGPNPQTLVAPADAFDMLAIGAVNSSGTIANFSSRGPTYDGRTKPAVCARGVSTYCAGSGSDTQRTTASGTSLSTPLAAGVCAQLIQARPTFTPRMIMQALEETASHADAVDNTYGHGILNLSAALNWGVNFAIVGATEVPFVIEPGASVQFTDESELTPVSWHWSFGDGDSALTQNPSHIYTSPGIYDVTLTIETAYGVLSRTLPAAVVAHTDSLTLAADTVYAGQSVTVRATLRNTIALDAIHIPIEFASVPMTFDSITAGPLAASADSVSVVAFDSGSKTVTTMADFSTAALPPGSGEILQFHFTIDSFAIGGTGGDVLIGGSDEPLCFAEGVSYAPTASGVSVVARYVLRGDANDDGAITSADIIALIQYIFKGQDPPPTIQSGDANADLVLTSADVIYLVNYVFKSGPAPPNP